VRFQQQVLRSLWMLAREIFFYFWKLSRKETNFMVTSTLIRVVAGVLIVVVAAIIISRRKKAA
jgi:hypothetical protein